MPRERWIEWQLASRPLPGERVSGDVQVVTPTRSGMLIAAIDGLGHGPAAANAAAAAAGVLLGAPDSPLGELLGRCHERLRRTRGAVITLVAFDRQAARLSWLGVGNVEAVLLRLKPDRSLERHSPALSAGVVGQHMRATPAAELALAAGDLVVLATDGIRSAFVEALDPRDELGRLAQNVIHAYGKSTDDALVLAVRYLGDKS